MSKYDELRRFMKSDFAGLAGAKSDQDAGLPQPPLQKPTPQQAEIIDLPDADAVPLIRPDFRDILKRRRSRRNFSEKPLALAELSFLLWATQGVTKTVGDNYATLRPVPSAGARHPFETYIAINRVEGLRTGVYRYLPLGHKLVFVHSPQGQADRLMRAAMGQPFASTAAATFVWACVAYRGEWRYGPAAHKPMLIDAGHVCQNLYLACEAIGCGTCAIAAYDQKLLDELLLLDGQDEFAVYLAPVGRK
ncbi:MAG: SagB/ThcOx family dehydrogenase [Planctomycetes bacterium]|nr:SagB/ThcOx family dehydrogenase [Planctomycetota bacterium]